MNPILRFLASLRNLRNLGAIKSIDEAYDFAKREFGEINDLLKRQIEQVFKKPTTKAPKPGEGGITSIKNAPKKETTPQAPGTSPLMERLGKRVKSLKEPENITTGLTRTIAREILMKRGIDLTKGMDPIEIFRKTFGQDVLGDVANIADELVEMDRMGRTPKPIKDILEQEGMFDIKMPKEPPQGYTPKEMEDIKKAIEQEDVLLKFDPKDRKPNSMGGINRTMYAMGSGVKLAKFLAKKGKNLKQEIKKAVNNIFTTDDIKYDADVAVDTMFEELGVDRDMFDQKDIIDAYGMAYDELKIPLLQKLQKPTKSIESMKKTGSIDISDPEIAGEMDRFAKETDPEGYKKMEEAMKKAADEAQPIEYFLGTRKKNSEGGLNSLMKRRGYQAGGPLAYDATDPIYGSSAITVTPDTVMGPGGNQIQDKMGKPGIVSPITGMPLPPGGYEAVGRPYIPPPIETNMPNIDGILPVVQTNPIEKIFQERTFNQVPEEYRSGFAEYVKQNPIGAGGQAMTPVGLPDGGSVMFGDTASAGAFRNYLKSIGVETPNSVPQLAIQQPLIDTKSILQDYGNSDFFSRISTTDVRPFTFGGEEMSGSSTYIGGLRNYLDSIGKSDLLQLPEPQTASLQKQQPLSPLAATAYFSKGGSAKRGLDYLMGM